MIDHALATEEDIKAIEKRVNEEVGLCACMQGSPGLGMDPEVLAPPIMMECVVYVYVRLWEPEV